MKCLNEIIIDEFGNLSIGEGKNKSCPFHQLKPCGDWCALFGEPEPLDEQGEYLDQTFVALHLCHGIILYAYKLRDYRKKTEKKK